jgi:acetolactate synthase-1/2/3 large subunit
MPPPVSGQRTAKPRRGADALLDALGRDGARRPVFTLSGNHIMSVFDAAIGRDDLALAHMRHEAAAVHAADAWARQTGEVGVALVTAGQGHANAAAALCTAMGGETPVLLLSGHAALSELGLGGFQEMRQADYAAPVTKASWMVRSAAALPEEVARASRIARSGRPGPVHLSLPADVLEAPVDAGAIVWPDAEAFAAEEMPLAPRAAAAVLAEIAAAARPLLVAGPALCTSAGRRLLGTLEAALGLPVPGMESPRGVNDPSLGAFAEALAEADLVVLLGKPLDFTLRFGRAPAVAPGCRWIVLDPDPALLARAARALRERLAFAALADASAAVRALAAAAGATGTAAAHAGWAADLRAALAHRPAAWDVVVSAPGAPVHPIGLCRALQPFLDRHPDAVLVSDGGEIGQWAQALLRAPHRLINGVAGAIGPSIPFAIGAKRARPESPVLAVLGDGTCGFHMAEFDTACRLGLPFVAVVGNDSRWNAEYQIQLRQYGANRAEGCALAPATRYDLAAAALGAHGEFVTGIEQLPAALERAFASGRPACVNVLIEGAPAPVVRRGAA